MYSFIFLLFFSFIICFLLTFLLRNIFHRTRFLKNSGLSKQEENRTIPVIGGISLYISFLLTLLLYFNFFPVSLKQGNLSIIYGLLIGGGGILLVGLLDDLYEFPPVIKLLGQVGIVAIAVGLGLQTQIIYVPKIVNILITTVWIVSIVNAFNLLDILDGLASGIALIISVVFLLLSIYTNNSLVMWLSLTLIGALSAFLIFNFPPAKIYLGDAGSMCIGYILSIIAINISFAPQNHEFALIAPILILGLPIYDMAFVFFRRLFLKKSVVRKSDDHFIFQLMKRGYEIRQSLYIMYSLSLFFGITAIAITIFVNEISFLIFLGFLVIFFVINLLLLIKDKTVNKKFI